MKRRILLFTLLVAGAQAFYLPGAAPRDFVAGESVPLFVNALTPIILANDQAKLKSMVNYDYYDSRFHFCQPSGGPDYQGEGLGSVLFGDRIASSAFDIHMTQDNDTCRELCTVRDIPPEDVKFINERIKEDYAFNWLIDGLPAAEAKVDTRTGAVFYDAGFNLGYDDEEFKERPALHNHYEVEIKYHKPSSNTYRVVGVLVWPTSIGGDQDDSRSLCASGQPPLILDESRPQTVRYSYRVVWTGRESETPWATRWDNYLHIFDPRIHWFSLINSTIIVVFLCIMCSTILYRNVSRDISRYNAIDVSEDVQEDWGWKLLHGEIFRSPMRPLMLSVLVGNGSQMCAMVGVTLVFALFGFLSPSNRGSIATVMIVCWSLFGSISGYVSSRVHASLGGTDKRKNAFLTATILPTTIFAMMFLLNLFLIAAGSSGAVPFGTMLTVVLLWYGISAPLSAVGSYFGSKHGGIRHPVRVNQIPRQIPPAPKYLRPWATALLAGILPFGAGFVELYFILSSLFASRVYYAFGFIALTAGVVSLTTATVTILFTYFLLCAEEYRWQWRSFVTGGGSAFWLLAYGLYYWATSLQLKTFSNVVLYLGYLLILSLFDFVVTGTIGFLASYWAIRKLYSAIRID